MDTARDMITRAFEATGYTSYTQAEVAERLAKVQAAAPSSVGHYAYTVGRNWAIDQLRRQQRERNRRRAARAERQAAARYRVALLDARREFMAILAELKPSFTAQQIAQCHVLYWRQLKGWTDEDVARLHPRTTRVTRQQWVTRARRKIVPQASTNLRRFLRMYQRSKTGLHGSI
jgi:DNA-directed RNA polymerase specialized sigma24 family protein